MISPLAKGDYEDLLAAGLPATLEDFDRLNSIALRLTNGAETTAANSPRIGWAGDVPFFQPTCAALSWYLNFAERAAFGAPEKDACWFFALAHARDVGAFDALKTPQTIRTAVDRWLDGLHVTHDEIARACRFAARGFDDADPGKSPKQNETDRGLTDAERHERTAANLEDNVAVAAGVTGIPPRELMSETPSRLKAMVDAVREMHRPGGATADENRLRADYDLTYREIRIRLEAEKKNG